MAAILTVDAVLLTLQEGQLHVALFKRENEPYKGHWALPGGYIHEEEDGSAADAAARVLKDKAQVVSPYLEEFGTFSGPVRDPRGWSLTAVYYALVPAEVLSSAVQLFPVSKLPALPFDHGRIVESVVARVRSKATYSSLPVFLCPAEFTISELHAVYQAVLGEEMNLPSFRRKVDAMGVLEEVPGGVRTGGRNRPAQLYRVKKQYRDRLHYREREI